MRWKGRRVSSNVEDRRGGGAKAGGISILGLIIAFVAWKFLALIHSKPIKPPSRSRKGFLVQKHGIWKIQRQNSKKRSIL